VSEHRNSYLCFFEKLV